MAASQSEADKLRQQIAFLTNLINSARNPIPSVRPPVPRHQQPSISPHSLGFGNVRGHYSNQQARYPQNQAYIRAQTHQPTPSRVSVEASNVRFPLSNTARNQANMAAGAALFNRHTNPNIAGTGYKPGVPTQSNRTVFLPNTHNPTTSAGNNFVGSANVSNILGPAFVRQQNPGQVLQGHTLQQQQNPAQALQGPTMQQHHNPAQVLQGPTMQQQHNPAQVLQGPTLQQQNSAQVLQGPTLQRQQNPAQVLQGRMLQQQQNPAQVLQGPTMQQQQNPAQVLQGPTLQQQQNPAQVLQGPVLQQQQNSAQVLQGPTFQQQMVTRDSRIGANFVHMSRPNADVCVQTTHPASTVMSTVANTNPILSSHQNTHPTYVHQSASGSISQGLLGPGVVQTSTGLSTQSAPATSSNQPGEPKTQQMTVLMEELKKTQSQILDLQKQLLESKKPQPQQPQQLQQFQQLQHFQQPQPQPPAVIQPPSPVVPSAGRVPGLIGVGLPGSHQTGIQGVLNVSAAHGQPLAQANKVWVRNGAQQVVGRPVRAGEVWSAFPPQPQALTPRHPTSLTGPRLMKPLHAQHPAPLVLNTRFQLKRMQTQAMANCIQQSVRAAHVRNFQQSVRAAQFQNMQQRARAAQFRNIQLSARTAQIQGYQQSVRAAQVRSMQHSMAGRSVHQISTSTRINNNTHSQETVTSIQSVSTPGMTSFQATSSTQMIVSKYKFQRAGFASSHMAAQAIVSKYKLKKTAVYGNRFAQMNQLRGKYNVRQPRFHQQYPYSNRFQSRFHSPVQVHQNTWRSARGRGPRAPPRNWKTSYLQRALPWRAPQTYTGRHIHHRGRQFSTYGSTSRVWKKRQWLSWKHRSQMAVKRLLRKRLQLLHKAIQPHKSKLKLDRRYKTSRANPRSRAQTRKASTRLVLINGLLYKSSSKSLTKATVSSPSHKGPSVSGATSQDKASSSGRKTSVVVRKMNSAAMKTIKVRGVKFRMDTSGRSLQRIDQSPSPTKSLSTDHRHKTVVKRIDIGGVTYIQTKPGTLVRSATARTRVLASRVKSRSIAAATQSLRKDNTKSVNGYCVFYNKFGRCKLGDRCPYKHDPAKVAVCTRFLRGTCKVDNCPFSHKVSREKMPVCLFFLRGTCNRDDCPYLHVKVNRDAAVCQDFVRGFCAKGEQCQKKHTLRCPSFEKSGMCPRGKNCPMLHKRAARRPQRATRASSRNKKSADVASKTMIDLSSPSELDSLLEPSAADAGVALSDIELDETLLNMPDLDSVGNVPSQVDLGVWKAADPVSSQNTKECGETPVCEADGQENTVSEASELVLLQSEAPAASVPSTSNSSEVPDKLPSFISLVDVSSGDKQTGSEQAGEQTNSDGTPLHIRPRL